MIQLAFIISKWSRDIQTTTKIMSLKATVSYKSYTKDAELNVGQAVVNAVGKSLALMERNIKSNTPIRHGHLARSITNKITGFGEGEVYTRPIEGGKEINYAVFVEYGTQHMAPRAMFRKGVAQSEERIKQIFAEETKKVVK